MIKIDSTYSNMELFIRSLEPVLIVLTGFFVFAVIWRFIVPLYSMLGEL